MLSKRFKKLHRQSDINDNDFVVLLHSVTRTWLTKREQLIKKIRFKFKAKILTVGQLHLTRQREC